MTPLPTALLSTAAVLLIAASACSGKDKAQTLVPGADISECRSALRVGLVDCALQEQGLIAQSRDLSRVGPAGSGGAAMEARVDDFLANYGKPPREAVRALLDPNDENIAAFLQKKEETLAIAAYVAERLTELQDAQGTVGAAARPSQTSRPEFLQMRVWLVRATDDNGSQDTQRALRDLALTEPSLQVGVILVGDSRGHQLRQQIGQIGAPLSVRLVAPVSSDLAALPLIRIEDLRFRRSREIDAQDVTTQQLRNQIISLRKASESATNRQDLDGGTGDPTRTRTGTP